MESDKLEKCQEKEEPYQQVFLVLGKSDIEVHDKIKSSKALNGTRLDFIKVTEKTQGELKVIMVKFKTNVKLYHVVQIFQLVHWDLDHRMKEKYAKRFHKIKKNEDLAELMETGISYEYLQQRDENFQLTDEEKKSIKKKLTKKLKNCIVKCKTPENHIKQNAVLNGKHLIIEILKHKWKNFNKQKCESKCEEPYCKNLDFQDYIEKKIKLQ